MAGLGWRFAGHHLSVAALSPGSSTSSSSGIDPACRQAEHSRRAAQTAWLDHVLCRQSCGPTISGGSSSMRSAEQAKHLAGGVSVSARLQGSLLRVQRMRLAHDEADGACVLPTHRQLGDHPAQVARQRDLPGTEAPDAMHMLQPVLLTVMRESRVRHEPAWVRQLWACAMQPQRLCAACRGADRRAQHHLVSIPRSSVRQALAQHSTALAQGGHLEHEIHGLGQQRGLVPA